ncbi:competence protein CoiA family protein [Klebsiella quasivariicola]|uniref:competence protein CoiA family protein n=1 Tax=Klebsiella quasivariicola TaxID=2026240 RepID=UPI0038D14103
MVRHAKPLLYGMLNGKATHISDVSSDEACCYRCPGCNARLIAKKGKLKQHHFAHAAGADCGVGVETALHLAAKEIIEAKKYIYLPPVEVKVPRRGNPSVLDVLAPEQKYSLDKVVLERRIDSIIPDVIAYVRNRALAIEIKVSHAVSECKAAHFQAIGMSAIEIDLSNVARAFTPEMLESFVIGPGKHKSWIFNAAAARRCEEMLSRGVRRSTVYRGFACHVDGCPVPARTWKGRAYANLTDDCFCCTYLLDFDENYIICGMVK